MSTSFYEDLLRLAELVDLGASPEDSWVHWCFVENPDDADGSADRQCCRSRDEAVEKTSVALLNVFLPRQWSQSAVSRWTYVGVTFQTIALGMLGYRVLPICLADMKALWNVKRLKREIGGSG